MAVIYYKQVKSGKRTIEDVPSRWRNAVQELLDKDGE